MVSMVIRGKQANAPELLRHACISQLLACSRCQYVSQSRPLCARCYSVLECLHDRPPGYGAISCNSGSSNESFNRFPWKLDQFLRTQNYNRESRFRTCSVRKRVAAMLAFRNVAGQRETDELMDGEMGR